MHFVAIWTVQTGYDKWYDTDTILWIFSVACGRNVFFFLISRWMQNGFFILWLIKLEKCSFELSFVQTESVLDRILKELSPVFLLEIVLRLCQDFFLYLNLNVQFLRKTLHLWSAKDNQMCKFSFRFFFLFFKTVYLILSIVYEITYFHKM